MKKLIYLLRVDALGVLGINRLRHSADRAAKRKAGGALALAAFAGICVFGTALLYFYMMYFHIIYFHRQYFSRNYHLSGPDYIY